MRMSICPYNLIMLTIMAFVKNTLLAPSTSRCREPEPEVLEQLQIDQLGSKSLHWTFWLIPEMKEMSKGLQSVNQEFVKTRTSYLSGRRECPATADTLILEPECPKYYVMQHDPNRIPQNMVHVQCSCKKCLHWRESDFRGCKPVYTYTPVLRRIACENGMYKYEHVLEAVPISCVCSSYVKMAPKYRPGRKMIA